MAVGRKGGWGRNGRIPVSFFFVSVPDLKKPFHAIYTNTNTVYLQMVPFNETPDVT